MASARFGNAKSRRRDPKGLAKNPFNKLSLLSEEALRKMVDGQSKKDSMKARNELVKRGIAV